jgi:thiamine-phosphate pyrophosphorylase
MFRYAITSGKNKGLDDAPLALAQRWGEQGIDYVQLREKHLDAGALLDLAKAMIAVFREHGAQTKLLVNGRADVAVAAGADGVHLTSRPGELKPEDVRRVFGAAGRGKPIVSASCHSIEDVRLVGGEGVDLILFGPIFEKRMAGEVVVAGVGLETLREASLTAGRTPVLALGGVTAGNAGLCVEAGAAGVAGIRLFG